ncbi:MAG: hypothetical protein HC849_14650 [Oscillatoriales cyanobacterium RU_3_3]|nr:hypothetical protein [Oscillatoriales cyanobacterium RU_3_3]
MRILFEENSNFDRLLSLNAALFSPFFAAKRIASDDRAPFDRKLNEEIVTEITGICPRNCSASLNEDPQNPKVRQWLL